MKARVQAASTLLLIALVLSLIPAAALTSTASAAQTCTDWAQFVADVTVPDGTRYDPGATFTKTWRLRNIGTCTWSTSYTMVFDSGTQMGSTASVPFTSTVAPGGTIDLSVNMTAPNAAGHYIGYWKFKNAAGTPFGIGYNANKDWWVEINVNGTPSGGGVIYDFTANAGSATWSSGAGGLSFPGTDGDAKGFALKLDKPNFESGVTASQPGLLFSPQQITNGFIQASYPAFTVQSGDRFQATVGCQAAATSCYVAYRLDYEVNGVLRTFWTFREKFEGWTYNANLNLSPLAGQSVKFILYISAWGSPVGDRALWGNPVITRPGVTTTITPTVTGTPPTPTPTNTPGPVTVTVPPSYCDRVQFVRDVTVPDGTMFTPGQTFTKTWRLKNVGSCAWSTSYQLVFFSGQQMSAPGSVAFTQNVAVGQTVDISVNMTAPATAGSYRGYWMFKNASGTLFGIGAQGNKPWWVDIKVSGPTATPTTPVATTAVATTATTPVATTAVATTAVATTAVATTAVATTAVATTAVATTPVTPAAAAFQNARYNFKFSLPSGSSIVSQTDTAAHVSLPIVTGGTNLLEKYVEVNVEENKSPCKSPAVDGATASTENTTINNVAFVKTTGQGVAAGNRYDWTSYSTVQNNACISLAFILHSANPGVYLTPPPTFDANAESAVIASTISSYNKMNP